MVLTDRKKWADSEKHPGCCGGLAGREGGRAAQVSGWSSCMDRVPLLT